MKKILLILLLLSSKIIAQKIPLAALETPDGETISSEIFTQQSDKLIVLAFWATWCIPCLTELATVNEHLDAWKEKYQFDFFAISTDDDRTSKKVASLIAGKGWSFKILLDTNQDFKRKLNINSIPYMIILKNGKIIYKKTGFVKGDELKIEKAIAENQ
jgi:thiol-disulfide isomerase/thioredoxin